ncbi:MAG: hypothetical protein JWO38_6522 [Gemmataceae bacterium]|nr:hypothetical protein [Gemmataceae bacterium]
MTEQFDSKRLVLDMLSKGWRWSDGDPDVLLHPADHDLYVRYNRAAGTLSVSPAMATALDLVIPTPACRPKRFWRDEQKALKIKTV